MEKMQYGGLGRKCPICSERIPQRGWDYCSFRCKDIGESRKPLRGANMSEVEELMRQFRLGNWTRVDGW